MKSEFKDFLSDINRENINNKMLMLPSFVFEHAANYADLSHAYKEKKDALDVIVSTLATRIRVSLERQGKSGVTETRVKDIVAISEEVINAKKDLLLAEKRIKRAKAYLEALKTAREVLPNVSNNFREERKTTGSSLKRR